MTTFPLEVRNDYLLASLNGCRWLVDTGCPVCIGNGRLNIGAEVVPLSPPIAGFDPVLLTEITGVEVAGVLGASVLLRQGCCIDAPGGRLSLGPGAERGTPLPFTVERVPGQDLHILQTTLAGRPARIVFDTGAPLGYLSPHLAGALGEPTGHRRDFIGMLGQWHETPVWELDADLAGTALTFQWGTLPPLLAMMFGMVNVDAVFGGELCLHRAVGFGPGGQSLYLL